MQKLKSILSQEGFLKYLKNTSWLISEKLIRLVSIFVVGIIIARHLGPEKYGMLNYAISLVTLFSAVASLGLDSIVVRELVKKKRKQNELIGTSFYLKLMGAVVVLGVLSIVLLIMDKPPLINKMILIIASSLFLQSFYVIDFYLQSIVQSRFVVYAKVISMTISVIVKLFLVYVNAPLIFFAIVFSFDILLISIGLLFFYKRNFSETIGQWTFDKKTAKHLLSDSWPLILSGIVISIYMKIDQIMIKEMVSSSANGLYSAAVTISEAWYIIPMIVSSSLFPAIINAKQKGEHMYLKRLQHLYDFLAGISLFVAIFISIFHEEIIHLLYGDDYKGAETILFIHIWSGIFVSLGVASGKWLINENLQKISLYRTSAGAIINILLNFIMIPRYGVVGAALTTLVSQIVSTFLFDLIYKTTRHNFVMKLKALFLISIIQKLLNIEKPTT